MHQQTYCLTLPKPFFKIFLFRIYAPTIHSTDIDFDETSVSGIHTSPRQSSHHKPIHQRHSPPNLHVHTTHKPIHQRPQTHKPNHRYHTPQIPQPYKFLPQPHKHIQPPQTHTHDAQPAHSTQARPPTQTLTLTLTPMHRRCCSTDAVAAPCTAVHCKFGQARQTGSD